MVRLLYSEQELSRRTPHGCRASQILQNTLHRAQKRFLGHSRNLQRGLVMTWPGGLVESVKAKDNYIWLTNKPQNRKKLEV